MVELPPLPEVRMLGTCGECGQPVLEPPLLPALVPFLRAVADLLGGLDAIPRDVERQLAQRRMDELELQGQVARIAGELLALSGQSQPTK